MDLVQDSAAALTKGWNMGIIVDVCKNLVTKGMDLMQHLLKFLKPYRAGLILGPFFKLLEAIFELIVPVVMAKIIDNGIGQNDSGYILKMCGVIVLLGICGLCFALTCQFLAAKCSYRFGTDLRDAVFRHVNTLSATEVDQLGTSTLVNRVIQDTTAAQNGVNMFVRLAVRAPFLIIGAVVMAFLIDAKLALIFVLIAPIVAFLLYFVMKRTVPMYRRNQSKLDAIARRTGENLDGMRVIRAFSRQQQEKDEFAEECRDLEESMLAVGKVSSILNPLTFMIMNLGIVAVLWFGGGQVNAGDLTQGDLTAFANYMTQILLAMVVMANLIVILTKAQTSAIRVHEVLTVQPSLVDGTQQPDVQAEEVIAFENVSFAYAGSSENSLEHISFTLRKGQKLGIIGGTGSGKSTLINLIPRFYDATEGEIRVFGKPVKDYDMKALRRRIGIVPQKAVLFQGTLAENLRWGDPDCTEETMRSAVSDAQMGEFLAGTPEGLAMEVKQNGRNFSGGQRQRFTIARALCRKPEILILDDSMSALDYATDAAVRNALRDHYAGMTTVMISQRTTSLMDADLILVMDDGCCVGQGTHEELLASCDVYREIYESQVS